MTVKNRTPEQEKRHARYLKVRAARHAVGVTSNGKPFHKAAKKISDVDRFWSKTTKVEGACWLWLGGVNRSGYGKFKVGGRTIGAHRMAYQYAIGPIPPGRLVCHRCDVPGCVNPAHLWLGTWQSNMTDKVLKGRQSRTGAKVPNPARGEDCGSAKLTEAQVRSIRECRGRGLSMKKIGEQFGVCAQTICNILHGKIWRHVA